VALFTLTSPGPLRIGLIAALVLFCAWAVYRPVLHYVDLERQQRATLAEAARLEGATLAARTVRHHLSNKLAVAIGYSELLVDDPRLPQDLEEQVQKIMASAIAAVETVDKLQEHIVCVQLDTSLAGPPLLDLDASRAVPPPGGQTATDSSR
jgi:signal transduction histidine kinase